MFNDNKGVSLILANTPKGRRLLEIAGKNMNIKQVPLVDAQQGNIPLRHSVAPYFKRDRFFTDYKKYGLIFCFHKYTFIDFFYRVCKKNKTISICKKSIQLHH